ncbi:hypothetical protein VM1G_11719 [Cytospora mali]|uniref:Uncharacterized protein n=1 Tax=Cytospora mali TaxID=578113 RepID=A0A194W3N1_CYTMA|nr:hypothetical protein VM1G_11719 [Valsa mali]
MERVMSGILIFGNMGGHTVDCEGAVLDPVGVATDDRAEVGVVRRRVDGVLACVVVACHHVLEHAISIRHKEVRLGLGRGVVLL